MGLNNMGLVFATSLIMVTKSVAGVTAERNVLFSAHSFRRFQSIAGKGKHVEKQLNLHWWEPKAVFP